MAEPEEFEEDLFADLYESSQFLFIEFLAGSNLTSLCTGTTPMTLQTVHLQQQLSLLRLSRPLYLNHRHNLINLMILSRNLLLQELNQRMSSILTKLIKTEGVTKMEEATRMEEALTLVQSTTMQHLLPLM